MNIEKKMRDQIITAASLAQKYTCQLFYNIKRIGSGFFIQLDEDYFLVSAAHVLEQNYIQNMMFPNGDELVSIKGELITTIPPEGCLRSADKIDFSVIKLHLDTVEEIKKKFEFAQADVLDIDHNPEEAPQYMLFGYPVEWTKVVASEKHVIPKPLIARTKMIDPESLSLEGYEEHSKFIVEYNPMSFVSDDGDEEKKLPNPTGMSGSALWYIPFKEFVETGNFNLKLVGLVTDYHGGWDHAIAATNITLITETIRQKMFATVKQSSEVKVNLESPEKE